MGPNYNGHMQRRPSAHCGQLENLDNDKGRHQGAVQAEHNQKGAMWYSNLWCYLKSAYECQVKSHVTPQLKTSQLQGQSWSRGSRVEHDTQCVPCGAATGDACRRSAVSYLRDAAAGCSACKHGQLPNGKDGHEGGEHAWDV